MFTLFDIKNRKQVSRGSGVSYELLGEFAAYAATTPLSIIFLLIHAGFVLIIFL